MKKQIIVSMNGSYRELQSFFDCNKYERIFVVCGDSLAKLRIGDFISNLEKREKISCYYFKQFMPNPEYDQIMVGVDEFKSKNSDLIIAVGGGSNIDVAKAVKYYSMSKVPILAIPTTAGSGAEATHFAVLFRDGEKKSVGEDDILPDYVFLDADALNSLPNYHRMSCMLDVLCHSIESIWSLNAIDESIEYAKVSLRLLYDNYEGYINNNNLSFQKMMEASYYAGKAINISKTTAAHAMAYKITKQYGYAHGHVVAYCMRQLLPYAINKVFVEHNNDLVLRYRASLDVICKILKINEYSELVDVFNGILEKTKLEPVKIKNTDIEMLVSSVNYDRLNNFPILLKEEDIRTLYNAMIEG